MTTLVEFLRARCDEDERYAFAALDEGLGVDIGPSGKPLASYPAVHDYWATRPPHRTLQAVKAKRALIARYERVHDYGLTIPTDGHKLAEGALYGALRDIALEHSDHPDWQERWRP